MGFEQVVAAAHCARLGPTVVDATYSLQAVDALAQPSPAVVVVRDAREEQVERPKTHGLAFTQEPRDERWLRPEARPVDPSGNVICLHLAGVDRLGPPWRVGGTA